MKKSKGMTGGSFKQPDVLDEGNDIASNQIIGIKKDIDRGAARFWAKRGLGDPGHEKGYNYGQKPKSRRTRKSG